MKIRLGSRKSALARLQAYLVAAELRRRHGPLEIEFVFQAASGDLDQTTPLTQMASRGVFTRDLSEAVISGRVDAVVHSWKDLDFASTPETEVLAALPRADQRDVLLLKTEALKNPPRSLTIYTSAPRRCYNLARALPELLPRRFQQSAIVFEGIRGNVETRLRKTLESDGHALIVAKAALDRMLMAAHSLPEGTVDEDLQAICRRVRSALSGFEYMALPLAENPNAPAQGALALEIRRVCQHRRMFDAIADTGSAHCANAERAILARYGGGCHQSIGVACLLRDYGTITIVRGREDHGADLDRRELDAAVEDWPHFSRAQAWPAPGEDNAVQREALPAAIGQTPPRFAWVSRAEAWPAEWPADRTRIIWAAGLRTWRNLARRDLWVHGSAEGLGEQEAPAIDLLAGEAAAFVRLTHEDSDIVQGQWPRMATYRLKSEAASVPPDRQVYFWRSASAFARAVAENPALRTKHHACGPGLSAAYIHQEIADDRRVRVYLDQEQWWQSLTKSAE